MNWQLKLDKKIYKERLRIYNLGFRKEKEKKRAKRNQRYFKTQESEIEDEFWNSASTHQVSRSRRLLTIRWTAQVALLQLGCRQNPTPSIPGRTVGFQTLERNRWREKTERSRERKWLGCRDHEQVENQSMPWNREKSGGRADSELNEIKQNTNLRDINQKNEHCF